MEDHSRIVHRQLSGRSSEPILRGEEEEERKGAWHYLVWAGLTGKLDKPKKLKKKHN